MRAHREPAFVQKPKAGKEVETAPAQGGEVAEFAQTGKVWQTRELAAQARARVNRFD